MANTNPRKLAVQILYNIINKKSLYSAQMSELRRNEDITPLDVRFVSEIVTGVLRNLEYLDFLITQSSDIRLNKISPYVHCVLLIGIYQIIFMDKVPHSAAVNECVKIIKKSSNYRLGGYVNAVLRKAGTNGMLLPEKDDPKKYLSIKYSCPLWLTDLYNERLGSETEQLLKCMNSKPDIILRVNTTKTSTDSLLSVLSQEHWECEMYKSELFPEIDYLIRVKKVGCEIEHSEAYKNGLFYVQDPAAAYVGHILNPKANSIVFDMCASPGGKTTHFAEIMQNTGKVYAFDVTNEKINKININSQRLGLCNITAQVSDSSVYNKYFNQMADYVVVDAPCSGLGIIRKKPDIKYQRKQSDISDLSKISSAILNAGAQYVKSGGYLLFSTCTITKEENENVLFYFLETHKEFKLKSISCTKDNDGYITLYPHTDDCDGFFISLMTKE